MSFVKHNGTPNFGRSPGFEIFALLYEVPISSCIATIASFNAPGNCIFLSQVESSFLTSFSRLRTRDRGLTRGDDSWCRGQVLTRQLTIIAEHWGGCRCHGRVLGGWPWWTRESNQYGERHRDVILWLGPWQGSMRWHQIFGRIYTLIVAEKKITAPAILYVA